MKKSTGIILVSAIFTLMGLSAVAAETQGQLKAIYTEISPPANFVQDGTLTGVSVEIVREIQARTGDQTPIEILPWSRAYAYATTKPNVMIFSITRIAEREPHFSWVGPLLTIEWCLYAKKNRSFEINSLEDAKQVGRIGTYFEDARKIFLQQQGFTNLESVSNNILNVRKLMADRIDLFVSSDLGIDAIMAEAGYSTEDVYPVFVIRTAELHMGFSKGTDEKIVQAWRNAFNALQRDGTIDAIKKNWFPEDHNGINKPGND